MREATNRHTGPLIIVFGVVFTMLTFILAQHFRLSAHTLANNGNWTVTKTTLAKRVFGAQAFLNGVQPLTLSHLDLGAWHGFQEVVASRPKALGTVAFRFLLEPNAWLAFIWDRGQETYSGVRFSVNPAFDTMRFQASDLTGFAQTTPLVAGVSPRTWHEAELRFNDGTVIILVDDRELARFSSSPPDTSLIAFRGSLAPALVDDILIRSGDELTFEDSFNNKADFLLPLIFGFAISLTLNGVAVLAARGFSRGRDSLQFYSLVSNLVLLIGATLFLGYRFFGGPAYPAISPFLKNEETRWKTVEAETINDGIQARYGAQKAIDEHRILLIGTSQTWGAGARDNEDTIASRLQEQLDKDSETQFTVINGGISALQSSHLLDLYSNEWLDLNPDTVIINLSNNDNLSNTVESANEFETNITEMVRLGNTRGIETVLVLEPNSIEWTDTKPDNYLAANHARMRKVAASEGVLLVDMQSYLRDEYDAGFLWWDRVHLSSLGQKLFANELLEQVATTLVPEAE